MLTRRWRVSGGGRTTRDKMQKGIRRVVIGVSGGVDSSVSALLLKKKGFDVVAAFMQNWDIADETGQCRADQDYEDAKRVCTKLGVPLERVNFVKEYWNDVFSELLQDYERGFNPNPDIRCNEFIKFRAFHDYARNELRADAVATGHYANTTFGPYLERFAPDKNVKLLKAIDTFKDQTFFLSRVPQDALRRVMFPVGQYLKKDVIEIARENGLADVANRKESTGICFIGNRRFQNFISEFVENKPGNFVDLETGVVVGEHQGIHCWTIGQGCNIGGVPKPYFVCRKDVRTNDIYVVQGTDHPALYSEVVLTDEAHWIDPEWADPEKFGTVFRCDFRFQHTKKLNPCTVLKTLDRRLVIRLKKPDRALTPGQSAVLYLGNECLGGSRIVSVGPSLYSLKRNHVVTSKIEDNCEDVDRGNLSARG